LRVDFNVPIEKGIILDDFRIQKSLSTIKYLIEQKAKVILMSHLGNPGEKMDPIFNYLRKILKIEKALDCIGEEIVEKTKELEPGTCLLLENLRKYEEETKNDREFSKELAKLGDIYINEAFSCSHRLHSSIVGITEFLPSGCGFLLEKEVRILSKAIENPLKPLVCIIGGVKIDTKIKLIKNLLKKSDELILGGELANTILRVQGICIGEWPEEKIVNQIQSIDLSQKKVHLPVDVLASPDKSGKIYVRESSLAKVRKDELLLDIGPESIKLFSQIIKKAETIILAGPLGYFENPLFEKGTKEIAKAIIKNNSAYKIAGGGDTLFSLSKFDLERGFDHISTGGGAMLAFLSGEKLPGLIALENEDKKLR
ncbi:MAG: phosphoglycerate kinase, partial [Candidatus Pacebacteria bacterium]|nr:phosphoglycerate kinase [Candidatus Paceibacterota bacterium]